MLTSAGYEFMFQVEGGGETSILPVLTPYPKNLDEPIRESLILHDLMGEDSPIRLLWMAKDLCVATQEGKSIYLRGIHESV